MGQSFDLILTNGAGTRRPPCRFEATTRPQTRIDMDLITPLETICRVIVRARELEAQVPAIDPDNDDPPDDADDVYDVLEDETDETIEEELRVALEDLAEDQIAEVLALAWVGRGTYDPSEWEDAFAEAGDKDAEDPVDQLLDMPMLAAYLDSGLAAFDLSCEGIGQIE
jgi:Protein of unknown function (DUF3775)